MEALHVNNSLIYLTGEIEKAIEKEDTKKMLELVKKGKNIDTSIADEYFLSKWIEVLNKVQIILRKQINEHNS